MCVYIFFVRLVIIICSIRGVPWSSGWSNSFTKDAAKVSVKGGFLDIGL